MSCCARVAKRLPYLVAMIEEGGFCERNKVTLRNLREDMCIARDIVDMKVSLQQDNRVDGSVLVDNDHILSMVMSFGPWKMQDAR